MGFVELSGEGNLVMLLTDDMGKSSCSWMGRVGRVEATTKLFLPRNEYVTSRNKGEGGRKRIKN